MHVAQPTKIHSESILSSFLPKKVSSQAILWALLPALLLLFNLGVSWLKPTPFTHYLPFLALVGLILSLCFKTLGLSISYAIIALSIFLMIPTCEGQVPQPSEKLWQMGIFFNIALTLYIGLLTAEEIGACFAHMHAQSLKNQNDDRQQELEEEIQRLKAEAEQRRIEKVYEQSRFELIQSEIELLNSQKNEYLEEARLSRAAFMESKQQWEQARQSQEIFSTAEKRYLIDQIDAAQNLIISLQQRPPVEKIIEKEVVTQNQAEINELQKALNKSQGLYQQLRAQFQAKTEILSQARRELFALQGKLETQEMENQQASLSPNREEERLLENQLHAIVSECGALEEEIDHLENMISVLYRGVWKSSY